MGNFNTWMALERVAYDSYSQLFVEVIFCLLVLIIEVIFCLLVLIIEVIFVCWC